MKLPFRGTRSILFTGFSTIIVLMISLTWLGAFGMAGIQQRLDNIVNNHMAKFDKAIHMRAAARERTLNLQRMILLNDPFKQDAEWMRFNQHGAVFAKNRLELLTMDLSPEERSILELQTNFTAQIIPLQKHIVDLINSGRMSESQSMLVEKAIPMQDAVLDQLERLYHYQKHNAEKAAELAAADYNYKRLIMYAISALVVCISILIAVFVMRSLAASEAKKTQYIEKIEEANLAKNQFLASISHELRTPLNAIINYSEMVAEDALADGNQQYVNDLQRINQSGDHLLALINDVLVMTQIEQGKLPLHYQQIELAQVVDEVVEMLKPKIEANHNQIIIEFEKNIGVFESDEVRLRQILINILGNACKFTKQGIVKLTADRNGDFMQISIQDTGIGIAPDKISKIFQAFTQADGSHTRLFGGTGLGLTITQKLCRLMGGEISVTSHEGEGSNFVIRLPVNTPVVIAA